MPNGPQDKGAELSEDDVLEILGLFERSAFDYLHLEHGGRKITVSKGGYARVDPEAAAAPRAPEPAAPPARPAPAAASPQPADEGLVSIVAPMIGKFYAAASPSDPPFVKKGALVAAGATLGLIEVMKVFASVKTEVSGVVETILVANGESVEQGQSLFLIRPQPDAPGKNEAAA